MSLMLSSVVEVVDGIAVGEHNGFVAPLATQDIHQQAVAGAAGHALVAVVGTHHLAHVAFLHQCLEGRQVGLPEVAHRHRCVVPVAQWFRTAMHGIVLGAGMGLEVFGVVALHAEHRLHTQYGIHIGVLAAGLLSPAPPRVAEDVHIGAPEGEFGVARIVDGPHGHIEHVVIGAVPVGAGLVGNRAEHIVEEFRVERGGHADGLGINGVASLAHTVASLAPPVVGGDAEAVDGYRLVHHQSHFLLRGEQRDEVLDALLVREVGVEVGIAVARRGHGSVAHIGLHRQRAERVAEIVYQFHAAVGLPLLGGRSEDHHHLALGPGRDGLVGTDGLYALARGYGACDDYRRLRDVAEGEGVADGPVDSLYTAEIPLVVVETGSALLLGERRCSEQQAGENDHQ